MTAGRYLCFERLACPRPCNSVICRTRFAVAQATHEGCFSRHISPVPPVSPPALLTVRVVSASAIALEHFRLGCETLQNRTEKR
jgi:hypothetical protein